MDTYKNYYMILGVEPTASAEQIKIAFRRMVKLYAPDVNASPQALKLFEEVLVAWNVLRKPATRRMYDQSLGFSQQGGDAYGGGTMGGGNPFAQSPFPSYSAQPSSPFTSEGQGSPVQGQATGTQRPGFQRPQGAAGAGASFQSPHRPWETVIRSSHRETERQRAAEGRRRKQQEEFSSYFERKIVTWALFLSFPLLMAAALFLLPEPFDARTLLKAFISSLLFGSAFWLFFWGLLFWLRRESPEKNYWPPVAAAISSCSLGVLYGWWAPWFFPLESGGLMWGGPYALICVLLALIASRE
ncbi:DnaJ domain-containing protein [uncultured Fretibacterium sp.]|uniref:J domain-containing protein n=1 Tax=uncultured Fretibacterium sp. TaxID=1678694 RepID=UPI002606ECB4|nr:DnaJ domain-containing protein [uncultured Fretibacterium sp.]